jgi:DNA-binding IclR family transcriptional regulator
MSSEEGAKYHVPAAAKTLKILETLANIGRPVTLQHLTDCTGLPKSSVFAILSTLESLRYVERDATSAYRLGVRALQLGAAATQTTNLSQLFHEAARRVVKECGETVQLSILQQTDVIYVAREDGSQPVQLAAQIGGHLPAYATASGKTMLAALPEESLDALFSGRQLPTLTSRTISSLSELRAELQYVRERGWSHDNQEVSEGLECFAAPVYDRTGRVVAAVSVSFLSARAKPEHSQRILAAVQRASKEISERMGWQVTPGNNHGYAV